MHTELATKIFREELSRLQRDTDAAFSYLLLGQWVFAIACALTVSPRTWDGVDSSPHAHLLAAVVMGGLLTVYPCWLARSRPGELATRLVLSSAQAAYSALLIHLMAGRIEAHFHVFGSLAFLSFYRDWRVFVPAIVVTAADHLLRGVLWPQSVFGVVTPSAWRALEHAAWVLFETSFLLQGTRRDLRQRWRMAELQASTRTDRNRFARDAARLSKSFATEQNLLRTIIDSLPLAVFWKDRDSVYAGCNHVFAEIAGLKDPSAVVGLTDYDLPWTEEEAKDYRLCDSNVMRSGEAIRNREETQHNAAGEETVLWTSKIPLRNAAGDVIGVVGAFWDATEKHRTFRELEALHRSVAERQALLEAIFDTAADGIVVIDSIGKIVRSNRAADDLLNGGSTLLGASIESFMAESIAAEHAGYLAGAVNKPVSGRLIDARRVQAVRADGGCFGADLSVSRVQHGNETLFAGILRDMSERARLESQLQQASRLESIGQLASGIAHEINTPMQFIATNVSFLKRAVAKLEAAADGGAATDIDLREFSETLGDCQVGVDRVTEIVGAMKDYAHPGGATHERVDVNQCLRGSAVITSNQTKHLATVRLDLEDCNSQLGSASALNHCFVNLIVNAADAIADADVEMGEIAITTRQRSDGIEVKVSDTGCGMPDDVAEHAFDPFFTTKGLGRGSGQGLAIAYRAIVQEHGGTIEIDSAPGEGTTFTIFLPRRTAEEVVESKAREAATTAIGATQ